MHTWIFQRYVKCLPFGRFFCGEDTQKEDPGKNHHEPPKTMKNKGLGHQKTRLFTINTSENVGFGCPWHSIVRLSSSHLETPGALARGFALVAC